MFWYSWIDPSYVVACIAVPLGLALLVLLFWKCPKRLRLWERWALVLFALALVVVPLVVLEARMDKGEERAYRKWPSIYE